MFMYRRGVTMNFPFSLAPEELYDCHMSCHVCGGGVDADESTLIYFT